MVPKVVFVKRVKINFYKISEAGLQGTLYLSVLKAIHYKVAYRFFKLFLKVTFRNITPHDDANSINLEKNIYVLVKQKYKKINLVGRNKRNAKFLHSC